MQLFESMGEPLTEVILLIDSVRSDNLEYEEQTNNPYELTCEASETELVCQSWPYLEQSAPNGDGHTFISLSVHL